jgi:hypothetical protein
VVVTLQVAHGRSYDDEPVRRVDTVSTIDLTDKGLVAQMLAARQSTDEEFMYPSEDDLHKVLSDKFGIKSDRVFPEIARREKFLSQLQSRGISSREEVKQAISDYYRSRLT